MTDRQIRLLRDWNVIEPGEFFFRCRSTVAAAHSLKLIRICGGANIVKVGRYDVLESVRCRCHKRLLKMTKTELELALAEATQTNKKTAGVFLDTLSALAYKTTKKTGEFVLPGFGKLVKQKRKARTGFNPRTQQKIRIPAKTVLKFRVAKVAKDTVLGVKK